MNLLCYVNANAGAYAIVLFTVTESSSNTAGF